MFKLLKKIFTRKPKVTIEVGDTFLYNETDEAKWVVSDEIQQTKIQIVNVSTDGKLVRFIYTMINGKNNLVRTHQEYTSIYVLSHYTKIETNGSKS